MRDPGEIRGTGRRRRGDRERHRRLAEIQANTNKTIGPEAGPVEVASIIVGAPYLIEWLKLSGLGQRSMDGAGEYSIRRMRRAANGHPTSPTPRLAI
jgi:hypothetical protein